MSVTKCENNTNIAAGIFQLPSASNRFALELFQILKENDTNVFFSPFNISISMGMLYLMTSGVTQDEIAQTMHLHCRDYISVASEFHKLLTSIDDGIFCCSNGLFFDNECKVKSSYKEMILQYMNANSENLDFKNQPENSRVYINSWVSSKTMEKIEQLLSQGSITSMSTIVVASALYFKGEWECPFDKTKTKEMDFHLADGSKKALEMMTQTGTNFSYSCVSSIDSEVIQIPYKNQHASMVIVLPYDKDGLPQLEKEILRVDFENDILNSLKPCRRIKVTIPKFKLECCYELSACLQQLGVKSVFGESLSDFSMGSDTPGLSVSGIYHKSVVDVDEEGTVAAASTDICLMLKSKPREFKADHPFLFAIVDSSSKGLMFLGRFAAPN